MLQPLIKKKYLIIMALTVILAIMSPPFLSRTGLWIANEAGLWIAYGVMGFTFLITLSLHQNLRFQKLHKKLRPFVVTRITQIVSTLGHSVILVFLGFKVLHDLSEYPNGSIIPHLIYGVLILTLIYQFFSIFKLAKQAKKDFPDRCEFC